MKNNLYIDGVHYLTAREAGDVLGYAPDYVSRLCCEGKLRGRRSGKTWIVEADSLVPFIKAHEAKKEAWHLNLSRELKSVAEPVVVRDENFQPLSPVHVAPRQLHILRASERAHAAREKAQTMLITRITISSICAVLLLFIANTTALSTPIANMLRGSAAEQVAAASFFSPIESIARASYNSMTSITCTITGWCTEVQPMPVVFVRGTSQPVAQAPAPTQITNNITNYIQPTVGSGSVLASGVSEQLLDSRLNAMENYLTGRIELAEYRGDRQAESLADTFSDGIGGGSFEDIDITDSTFTGGSISGASLSGVSFSGETAFPAILTTNATTTNLYIEGSFGFGTSSGLLHTSNGIASTLANGSNGQVLKMVGGNLTWSTDLTGGGGGGASFFASTTDDLAIYPADPSQVVIIGESATTTVGNILEVAGNALVRGGLITYGNLTSSRFVATSSTASVFPYASTTALSTNSLCIAGDCRQAWPTFTDTSFSTSSADYWQTQRNFFSTTSADYYKLVNNFFSTTSADAWKDARNFFSTTSASYFLTQNQGAAFSSTSAAYFLTQNGALGFSTTSANYFVSSSTTIPKTYTANTFSGTQTFTNASATNISATYASSTSGFFGNLSIGSLSGFLKATAGSIATAAIDLASDVTGILGVARGGTGWNTVQAGTLLYGNGSSALATTSAGTSGHVLALVGNVPTWVATTTFSSGLTYSGGNVTLDASGNWSGTFDGLEGSAYLANSFSTTSADYWKLNRDFFSTTSASYFASIGLAFSTTSADAWKDQRNFFSTTSAQYFVHSSTTIPKMYSSNTWTGTNIFSGTFTLGTLNGPLQANNGIVSATSSIGVLYGGTGLTTAPSYGQMLVGNASGGYTLMATSSLGLSSGSSLFTDGGVTTYLTSSDALGLGTTTANSKLTVYGDLFLEGSGRYLNFGTATGTTGYGFRDNAGTVEFKNSGGSWTPFDAISGGTGGGHLLGVFSTSTPGTNVTVNLNGTADASPSFSGGTLTLPSNTSHFVVEVWGSGGGGGGSGGSGAGGSGGSGGSTCFGTGTACSTPMLSAAGGNGGSGGSTSINGVGGSAGAGSDGNVNMEGSGGSTGVIRNAGGTVFAGGVGGNAPGGGGGGNGGGNGADGGAGNPFGGGGGGAGTSGVSSGGGGGGGGYSLELISSPSGTYSYTVGAGGAVGAAGSGGGFSGGRGGHGGIKITVYTSGVTQGAIGSGAAGYLPYYSSNTASTSLSATSTIFLSPSGNFGIGSTTPWAKLSIQASAAQTNPLFEIASSSTATKFLSVSATGFGTTTLSGLNISGSATSTSNVGFNITSGCYAVGGVCLSAGGSGAAYPFGLAGNATSTLTQFNGGLTAYASSTIGAGGQATGLTINGGATTTGNAYFGGNVGIGTTSPGSVFSIGSIANFQAGTSTLYQNLNVQGQLKVGTNSIYLNGSGTSTFSNGIDLAGGCFSILNTCVLSANTSGLVAGDLNTAINSSVNALQIASSSAKWVSLSNGVADSFGSASVADASGIDLVNSSGIATSAGMIVLVPDAAPSGGSSSSSGGDSIRTFTSNGTFYSGAVGTAQILVVGGGGGGGGNVTASVRGSGGGGAGEYIAISSFSVTPGTSYAITVGTGGGSNTDGATTTAFGLTARGGGAGAEPNNHGKQGGSGGGAGDDSTSATGGASTAVSPGVGFSGGNAGSGGSGGGGAGGGGAAGTGGAGGGNGVEAGGAGGSGIANTISGASVTYSSGGAGGTRSGNNNGTNGATPGSGGRGAGGGASTVVTGGTGADGIVIVRYTTVSGTGASRLISNTFTASSSPSTAKLFFAGTSTAAFTLNTDIAAAVSRDGGTSWSTTTLKALSTLEDGSTLYGDTAVDLSGQPAGTSMKYRILVSPSSPAGIMLRGVSLQWGEVSAQNAGTLSVTGSLSAQSLSLTSALGVANGGTGLTSINSGSILFGNGTGAIGTSSSLFWDTTNQRLGIGTSTPYSKLSVWGGSSGNIFEVVTSASSSALSVSGTGFGTTTLSGLNISGSATTTSNVGMNITSGCYAVGGVCLSSGASLSGTTGELAYFSSTNTAVGTSSIFVDTNGRVGVGTTTPTAKFNVWGDMEIGSGSTANLRAYNASRSANGFLTLYDGSTGNVTLGTTFSTGDVLFTPGTSGNVGIGTSTPWANLSISSTAGVPQFVIGSSTTQFIVDKNGNVGIGNANPLTALHIGGGTTATNFPDGAGGTFSPQIVNSQTSGVAGIGMSVSDGVNNRRAGMFLNQTDGVWGLTQTYSTGSMPFVIMNASAEQLRITSAGRVGIGTSTPWANLSINSIAGSPQFVIGSSTTQFIVDSIGRVGIGTSSPSASYRVHIVPTTNSTGALRLSTADFAVGGAGSELLFDFGATTGNTYSRISALSNGEGSWNDLVLQSGGGSVGIGSTSPSTTLGVAGSGYFTGGLGVGYVNTGVGQLKISSNMSLGTSTSGASRITIQEGGAGGITFYNASGAAKAYLGVTSIDGNAATDAFRIRGDSGFHFSIAGFPVAVIDTSGNLGIGTTSPGSQLHVSEAGSSGGGTGSTIARFASDAIANGTLMVNIVTDDAVSASEYFLGMQSEVDSATDSEFLFRTNGTAVADGSWTGGGADYAEYVLPTPGTVSAGYPKGSLICIKTSDPDTYGYCSGANDEDVIGVVSTFPAIVGNAPAESAEEFEERERTHILLSMLGRVPLRVSLEGGDIKIGDRLTSSSIVGVAMKATTTARTVGIALDTYTASSTNASSTIMVYIDPELTIIDSELQALMDISKLGNASSTPDTAFTSTFFANIFSRMTSFLADAGNGITEIFTKTLRAENVYADTVTADEICVKKSSGGHVCITGDELQAVLGSNSTIPPVAPPPNEPGPEPEAPAPETPEESPESEPETETPSPEAEPEAPAEAPAEPAV